MGARVAFTDAGTFFASVTDCEKLRIPDHFFRRCDMLVDLFDQHDTVNYEIPIQISMENAKSWLLCAEMGMDYAADLAMLDDETLLGALKVSNPVLHLIALLR